MKRKLIIHDWTFFNYTEIQQEDFYILVEDLLNDGFEIYFWSGEAVKEITPENWYQYRWDPSKHLLKGSLKYTSSTNIKKWATEELLWAEDDLFILDDYWLPVLRDHLHELPPRQLLISDLAKYSNPEEILSNSLGLTPKIEQVVLDEISSLAAHFYLSMKKFIESLDLKIIIRYKNLNLSDPEIGDLLQNKALNLFDLVIKKTDLHDIESVCFDDYVERMLENHELDELFALTPKVKRLFNMTLDHSVPLKPIPHLECLTSKETLGQALWGDPLKMRYLSYGMIEDDEILYKLENLGTLIESATTYFLPNLSALKNLRYVSSSSWNYQEEIVFKTTTRIDLAKVKLSDYNSDSLFAYSSNLKELSVETLPLNLTYTLSTLEILTVKNISFSQLREINRAFPNLKKLVINEIVPENDAKPIAINLDTIVYLEISDLISSTTALTLLKNGPNLKELFVHCEDFPHGFSEAALNLPLLEHLVFNGNKNFLYFLLKNAPTLKILRIESLNDSPSPIVSGDKIRIEHLKIKHELPDTLLYELLNLIKPSHLKLKLSDKNSNLERLPLSSDLISLSVNAWVNNRLLNNLLSQTPRLQKLILFKIQTKDWIRLSPNLSLSLLKVLNFSLEEPKFSLENINSLGMIAPNLESLILTTTKAALSGQILLKHPLNHLKRLNIRSANLTSRDIQNILVGCPKLTQLYLSDLKLAEELSTASISTSVKYLILDDSLISNAQLIQLLRCFPELHSLSLKNCKNLVSESIRPFLDRILIVSLLDNKRKVYRAAENAPSKWCDFNTRFDQTENQVKRYFYSISPDIEHPPVAFFRLKSFNALEINPNQVRVNQAVMLKNIGVLDLQPAMDVKQHELNEFLPQVQLKADQDKEHYHYLGQLFIELSSEWQALPSVSPIERLTDIALDDNVFYEISYSKRDNFYYIRVPEESICTQIRYAVRVPRSNPEVAMPANLIDDINYLLRFRAEAIRNMPQEATGTEFLNLIWNQAVGACRHRSMLFLWRHPENVRVIENDCHAFVEVMVENEAQQQVPVIVNLGGYPARLNVVEDFLPPETIVHEVQQTLEDPQIAQYAARLEPWKAKSMLWTHWHEFADEMLQPGQKILLEVSQEAEVTSVWQRLTRHLQENSQPYFYLAHPDDLHCALPYLALEKDDAYRIHQGPGGPLYDFLIHCPRTDGPGVLIVNYDAFDVDDLIRTNSLLDPERQIEGVVLPPTLAVIGIRNSARPDAYEGADFISRWHQRIQVPPVFLNSEHTAVATTQATCTLDLWEDADAREMLLGRWRMMGTGFTYEEGLLAPAVRAGHRVIALRNAPHSIRTLGEQLSTLGWVVHNGRRLEFPRGLQFQWTSGFDWSRLSPIITWLSTPPARAYVLNPGHFPAFFNHYIEDAINQNLQATPGWIQQAAGHTLTVTVSRDLSEGQWAQLLHHCLMHEVMLEVFCPQSVSLPEVLGPRPVPQTVALIPNLTVILSTERDTTVLALLDQHPQARFADITECTAGDLWQHWHSRLDAEASCLRIWHQPGWLQQALAAGETVILTGTFSAELQDALQIAWCGPKHERWPGQLLLVTEQATDFPLIAQQTHIVSPEEKKTRLLSRFSDHLCAQLTPQQWSQESVSQLQARLRFIQRTPQGDSNDAWQGLQTLKPKWDEYADAHTVLVRRKAALEAVWAASPYACIVGLTGGGKTTFISKIVPDEHTLVYYGEEQQEAWAQAKGAQRHILCLDEGNLSTRQRSELEGLCLGTLGMPWGPNYYTLTPRHKVVVLMNPQAEGGLRQLPSLFLRHGNTLIFDPLPPAFIAEQMIKPLLGKVPEAVAAAFFAVYRFACMHSTTRILMTPRDIAMMACLYLGYLPRSDERIMVAQYVAYHIGKSVLPQALHADLLRQFQDTPQPLGLEYLAGSNLDEYGFVLTPSRLLLVVQLQELFAIRQLRQQHPSWQSRGLGGLMVESSPGLGKSELMRAFVRSQGMVLWNPHNQSVPPENPYMVIPASLPPAEKKSWLLHAFHAGAVVLMDEMNSGPVVEDLLNALLCGETPDKEPAKCPGFLLLATQNPPTMPGRVRHTSAIERRLLHATLEEYPQNEVEHILRMQGLPAEKAKALSTAFERKRQEGIRRGYAALPTLRDVITIAKEILSRKRLAEAAPENEPVRKKGKNFGFFSESEQEEGVHDSESLSTKFKFNS